MTILTIDTRDKKVLDAVKTLLKGFKVPFEEKVERPYDPAFVAMIKESEQQVKQGDTVILEEGANVWDLVNTK